MTSRCALVGVVAFLFLTLYICKNISAVMEVLSDAWQIDLDANGKTRQVPGRPNPRQRGRFGELTGPRFLYSIKTCGAREGDLSCSLRAQLSQ